MLLVWWLEHVNVITSLQFLRTYTGCLLVNEWSPRRSWWSGSVSTVLLLSTSATSAHLPWPHPVERSCALRPVELYWFRASGLRRGSEVSPSTTSNSLPSDLRAPELSQNAVTRAPRTHLFSTARHIWDDSYAIPAPNTNALTDWLT